MMSNTNTEAAQRIFRLILPYTGASTAYFRNISQFFVQHYLN